MSIGALQLHDANLVGLLLALIPMILNAGIFVYAVRRLPRDQLTGMFLVYIVGAMLWQGFDCGVRLAATPETARFLRGYFRIGQIYGVFVGLHFALLYAERERLANAWWFWLLLYLPPTLQLGGYMGGHWEEHLVYHEGWGYLADASKMGVAYQAHLAWGSVAAVSTLGVLIWNTWRVRGERERFNASLLLTVGLSIAVVLGVLFEAGLPILGFHQYPITSTVTLAYSLATVIGLTRYRLFRVSTPAAAKAMVEALTDPLIIAAADGRLLYANERAGTVFGLDREHIRQSHLRALFPNEGDAMAFFAGRWRESLAGARANGLEARFRLADGEAAPFLVSLAPIPLSRDGDLGVAVVAHDVTRLKAVESDLVEARDQAEFANRTKSEFLANMSHELRTPLNAIIGYAELLVEDVDDPEVAEDLERIRRSGRYLLDLINDVLDLSKVESGRLELQPEPVSVRDTLAALRPTFDQLMSRNGNTLVIEALTGPHVVMADPTRLRQVLLNLVSNAAKFTEKGTVTVRIGEEGGTTRIDVEDDGIGMTEESVSRLFGMFTQVHQIDREKYGGTGLGLALSRRLCNLMGGDVLVLHSEPGVGSTFRIELPSTDATSG
ncbi:MAG: PAS domain-containing protein [Alphaproteobacteria bacterium]|nr:PAS domain-containing protein [Alphaproteobacteria bacterium]